MNRKAALLIIATLSGATFHAVTFPGFPARLELKAQVKPEVWVKTPSGSAADKERCVPARPPLRTGRLPETQPPSRNSVSPQPAKDDRKPAPPVERIPDPRPVPSSTTSAKAAAIREKMARLKQLLKAKEMARQAASAVVPSEANPAETATQTDEVTTQPDETATPTVETTEKPEDPGPAPSPAPVTAPSDEPQVVTTAPVNRLKLADNLFGAGRNDLALQAYSSIDLAPLNEVDQAWVQFQIASCHRRMGKKSEAEKHYRIVASYKHGGNVVDAARWWLDRLHAKKELTVALGRLTTIVDALKEGNNDN